MDDIENYEVLSIIGTGSFGTCYRVKNKINDKEFVWKAVEYGKMSEEKKQLLVSEVNLLSKLKHPNIVQYFNHIIHKKSFTLYIIMEYCSGGDLSNVIKTCKENNYYIEEVFIWRVLYQISSALDLCHSQCASTVLHRDIKPANVFLDSENNVKLGDFGLAKIMSERDNFTKTFVGTPLYMSPELVRNKKYNTKSDVWALGCLIYELSALKAPFNAELGNLNELIKKGKYDKLPDCYTDELQNMISFMLNVEANSRPSVNIILRHPTVLTKSSYNVKNIYRKTTTENDSQSLQIRLENLRSREALLKVREEKLAEKERTLVKREKKIAIMERMINEKMLRADLYLKQSKMGRSRSRTKKIEPLDESLSADPGDSSILPTSTKISEDEIIKPKGFQRSHSERRVHFNRQKVFEKNQSDEVVFKEYVFDGQEAIEKVDKKLEKMSKRKSFGLNILKSSNSQVSQSNSSLGSKSSSSATDLQNEVNKIWTKENKKFAFALLKTLNNDTEKENIRNKVCHTQL